MVVLMKKHVVMDKQVGDTPLMAIGKWKEANPEYKNISASYAGRLDPMASGKLLVLLGGECKKQKEYTKLDKEYEIEVLLDVGSDTGDALGLVEYAGKNTPVDNFSRIDESLKAEEGSHVRSYPVYSSKTVQGKPLFMYALEGTLDSIEVPTHEEHIYRIKFRRLTSLPAAKLSQRVTEFLKKVPISNEPSKALGADFRIDAVLASWEKLLKDAGERNFAVLTLRVTCGSGTYMRSLAPRIGEALGTRALALSIHRSKIGRYWRAVHYLHAI
jgi:tRNA U55 pseudouridine synthase TruB